MNLPIFDGHGVDTQLLRYEVYGVKTVFHLLDLCIFRYSSRAGDCRRQIEGCDAWKKNTLEYPIIAINNKPTYSYLKPL